MFQCGATALRVESCSAAESQAAIFPLLRSWATSGTCLAPLEDSPLRVGGACVSLWPWASPPGDVSWGTVGELAARFHAAALATPVEGRLSPYHPFPVTVRRLDAWVAGGADPAMASRLQGLLERISSAVPSLPTRLGCGPVHGDLNIHNLMSLEGRLVLVDFGSVGLAAREMDLAATVVAASTGEVPPSAVPELLAGYGSVQVEDLQPACAVFGLAAAIYYLTDGATESNAVEAVTAGLWWAERSAP